MEASARILSDSHQASPARKVRRLVGSLLRLLVTHHQRNVWECHLDGSRQASVWTGGERLQVIGRLDALSPALVAFLGGDGAAYEIEGVRQGDRLFVARDGPEFLGYSYVFFDTTAATRRQKRILLESPETPVFGLSFVSPHARGRGIYKRLLNDMFRWLEAQGARRVVCEVDPRNAPSNAASLASGMSICRELTDWTLLRHLVIQKVREGATVRWRLLVV